MKGRARVFDRFFRGSCFLTHASPLSRAFPSVSENFLFHGEKQMHGVLQRFVESKGDRNGEPQSLEAELRC